MKRMRYLLAAAMVLASLQTGPARAASFDFSDTMMVNFTSFQHDGVQFSANPAGFASYGTGYWTGAAFVDGSALEIAPGASVTLDFLQPMSFVQFGAAIGDVAALSDLASIRLFAQNGSEIFPVSVESPQFGGLGDAERRFAYLGSDLRRAVFSYSPLGQSVLAIDNLTLTPISDSHAPEPGTAALLLGAGMIVLLRRERRH